VSKPPRSSPSSSSSSEVLEIAESVTGAGRLCPFSLEIWVLTLYPVLARNTGADRGTLL